MGHHLHGQHLYLHQGNKRQYWENPTHPTTTSWQRPLSEARKMCILADKSWISRTYNRRKQTRNGPSQTIWNCQLANPEHAQTSSLILGLWQLLPMIHPRIWKHNPTTQRTVKERRKICMDQRTKPSIQNSETAILMIPRTTDARHNTTVHYRNWRLEIRLWSSTPPAGYKWRYPPMQISLQVIQRNRVKLQNIRPRTPSNNPCTHWMVTLPHGIFIPSYCQVRSQNLTYFCTAQKLNRRQARWTLYLSEFDLNLIHIPGTQMVQSDSLSRRADCYDFEQFRLYSCDCNSRFCIWVLKGWA